MYSYILSLISVAILMVPMWSMPMYCENDPCATYNCTEGVPDKHKLPCGPNQYNRTGGFCNCCEVCITIVEEGGACPVIAGPPVYDICDEGLICDVNATCVISS